MDVTVIIPARNEAQRIGGTLERYLSFFKEQLRYLVVVNGTTDQTERVVRQLQTTNPRQIDVLVIAEAVGKGGAVQAGFQRVHTPWVAYLDADGATPPQDFQHVLDAAAAADGAIASRLARGSHAERTTLRHLTGWGFALAVRLVLHLPFRDTQCGAKVFRNDAVRRILPNLVVRNMAFDVELLARLVRNGQRIIEVPTHWREVPGTGVWTNSLLRTAWTMFTTLLTIRRRLTILPRV